MGGVGNMLLEVMVLTIAIHIVDTFAYSVRLNTVKSGQVALSFSLFNMFVLLSRTANTFQAPLVGSIIGKSNAQNIDPLGEMRLIILAASLGTLLGIVLIPTFLRVFEKAVTRLALTGSVPSLVIEALHVNNIKRMVKSAARPSKSMLEKLRFRQIPKRILLINIVVTGIYTIGVLAANYATTMVPEESMLAAANSSALINGMATVLLTLFIDPKSAIITDQALKGTRPYGDVKVLVVLLIGTKLLGTLLGQALFLPAAQLIAAIYR